MTPAGTNPPPSTRSSARKVIFDRVLKKVVGLADDDLLLKALDGNGCTNIIDLLNLSPRDIDGLSYYDGTTDIEVPLARRNLVRILQAWSTHLRSVNGLRSVDWMDTAMVTEDEWDDYRIAVYSPGGPTSVPPTVTSTGGSSVSQSGGSRTTSEAENFKRGIKRDKSHYSVLSDEKQWDDWKRSTFATIFAHGCENVISPSYLPTTAEEILVFKEQCKFMYDVWNTILKTAMGKHCVRQHEATRDAQAIWRDLVNFMRTSTRADIEIEDLMSSLTSLRVTPSYRGTTQQFILDWLDKLRLYEDLTPQNAHFPDIMKKSMLQNSVGTLKIFQDVKTSEQIDIAKGKGPIKYREYVSLIQQVAATHDNTRSAVNRRTTSARQANETRLEYYLHDQGIDEEVYYGDYGHDEDDLNEQFGSMYVNANEQRRPPFRKRGPSLPKAVWQDLSREDQVNWDKMTEQAKYKIIFAYRDHMGQPPAGPQQPSQERRKVNFTEGVTQDEGTEVEDFEDAQQDETIPSEDPNDNVIVNAMARKSAADVRRMLSNGKGPRKPNLKILTKVHEVSTPSSDARHGNVVYHVSNHKGITNGSSGLMDRGANGGLAGHNMRVVSTTDRRVDITGINDHQMTGLKIVTAGAVIPSQRGDILGIFPQYARVAQGRTIHSSIQLESFGCKVDDRSKVLSAGTQTVTTPEGYVLPLDFKNGLPYLPMRPYTDKEWSTLPHVVFTSDVDWDPSIADLRVSDKDEWYDAISDDPGERFFDTFDEVGNHRAAIAVETHFFRDQMKSEVHVNAMKQTPAPRTFKKYRDYFLRASAEVIKKTFEATTQYARSGWITGRIYDTHRSPFPALNVRRRNEPVATDTFFSDVPAIDDGAVCAQFYCGTRSKYTEVHGMKSDSHFIKTLWDSIRKYGAMDTLVSDRAQLEISGKVQEVLRYLCIKDRQSEPYHQNQNPAERRYGNVKHNHQGVMNMSGAPGYCWLLCIQYTCFIMNRMALHSLKWRTPYEVLHGQTPDISMVYRFKFYDRVYYKRMESRGVDTDNPSDESSGYFVGFSEDVGHPMTYKVLTEDTLKVIFRSRIRLSVLDPNRQLDVDDHAEGIRGDPNAASEEDDDDDLPMLIPREQQVDTGNEEENDEPDARDSDDDDDDDSMPSLVHQSHYDSGSDGDRPVARNRRDKKKVRRKKKKEKKDEGNGGADDNVIRPSLIPGFLPDEDGNDDDDAGAFEDNEGDQAVKDVDDRVQDHRPGGMPIIDAQDLIGRTYLAIPSHDGVRERLRIKEVLEQEERTRLNHPTVLKFKAVNSDETYEEIVTYNQIMNHLDDEDGDDGIWHFQSIDAHQGPLAPSDPRYNGSRYNVRVTWENGEITWEPQDVIGRSDPVTVAIYARDNDLLEVDGWKRFKRLALRQKKLLRMANQAKLQSFRNRIIFKFGIQVPQSHKQAMELDRVNGNTLWRDSEETELKQIDDYEAFSDLGFKAAPPKGYKKIRVHMVYDCKHDLRRKSRLVADGNLTEIPLESVYSSVVSLRGLRTTIFLAELNQLDIWCTDIGNAYLEAETKEKIYIVAGNEFGSREGHILVIHKALYGLRSSGIRWWQRFSEVLIDMGFFPSKAEDDIWMRDKGDHYEYIARYVDDLAIASNDPKGITDELMGKHKFKLKGTGPISYHLGCDFYRDSENILCMAPKRYIERMADTYEHIFGSKPKTTFASPLERGDHPELDTSEELGPEGIRQYQSLMGAAQWLISLGRFDAATAVMTMSSFRIAPREGHMTRVKRIYGYVWRMKHGAIRFRVDTPDYSDIVIPDNDWARTIYGDVNEEMPHDAPKPLGRSVRMTTYVDANLMHCMATGRSVSAVLHFLNQTPTDFFTKKQGTVETATYGSEFVAARTATEQIIDQRISLRYLGVRIDGPTFLFGDNKTVVDSSMTIASRLHKRHVLLSYHRVREAIAANVLHFIHIPGAINPADILSKAWGYTQVKVMLKALLFWEGDTEVIDD